MAEEDDNDNNDNDAGGDAGTGTGAGGQGRGLTSDRELSKVQSVVEIAEEWLSRVREALTQSAAFRAQRQRNRLARHQRTTLASDNNEAKSSASSSSDPQATIDAAGDGEGGGGGDEEDESDADPLEDLHELLKESDEMPVYMEEAALLRTHLLALEWANKAALVLPLHATTANSSEEGLQDGYVPHDSSVAADTVSGSGTGSAMIIVQQLQQQQQRWPRLVEVQRLAKEIRRIRSTAITQQQQQAGSKAADDWERSMSLELPEEGNHHHHHHHHHHHNN